MQYNLAKFSMEKWKKERKKKKNKKLNKTLVALDCMVLVENKNQNHI